MNKIRAIRGIAKQFRLILPVVGLAHAGVAQADACEDSLVAQVFAHHVADPTPDTKMALHAWLCEGASDAFLSQQSTLPTSTSDFAAWNALLGAIDTDTEISSTPVGMADVDQFRDDNCTPSSRNLIHALGRVASPAEFEAWHVCDTAAVDAANGGSEYIDLDLSCAGQETATGTFRLSVRGFNSLHSHAETPLRDFVIGRDNLTPVTASAEIPSGQSGMFEFTIDDPTLESSVTLRGTTSARFGDEVYDVYYFCDIVVGKPTVSTPYILPPNPECAFETLSTNTPCPGGLIEQRCNEGQWENVCVSTTVLASKDVAETHSSFIPNNGDAPDGDPTIVMKSAQMQTTLDRVEFDGFVPRPQLPVVSAQLVVYVDTPNAPITLYGPNGETLANSPAGPAGPRAFNVTQVVQGWNSQNNVPRLFKLRATPTTRIGTGKDTAIRALEFAGTESDPRLEVQY
jgi:hypothetical protein